MYFVKCFIVIIPCSAIMEIDFHVKHNFLKDWRIYILTVGPSPSLAKFGEIQGWQCFEL